MERAEFVTERTILRTGTMINELDEIVGRSTILPEQFFDMKGKWKCIESEKKLMHNGLLDAMKCRRSRSPKIAREALAWFNDENETHLYSLISIGDVLNINQGAFREWARKIYGQREKAESGEKVESAL